MLTIQKIDHISIRIHNKERSIAFYQILGFKLITDLGFDEGRPIIMQHPTNIVLNLLGPSTTNTTENILMDVKIKYAGYTHISFTVASLAEAEQFFQKHDIKITERFTFQDLKACFIRDPDGNVIELDEHSNPS